MELSTALFVLFSRREPGHHGGAAPRALPTRPEPQAARALRLQAARALHVRGGESASLGGNQQRVGHFLHKRTFHQVPFIGLIYLLFVSWLQAKSPIFDLSRPLVCSTICTWVAQAHYGAKTAAAVAGLGLDHVFPVETDARGRMRVDDLRAQVQRAKQQVRAGWQGSTFCECRQGDARVTPRNQSILLNSFCVAGATFCFTCVLSHPSCNPSPCRVGINPVVCSVSQGADPFFVVATCSTTVLGAFDPLNDIADVCEEHGMWLHADVSLCVFVRLLACGFNTPPPSPW